MDQCAREVLSRKWARFGLRTSGWLRKVGPMLVLAVPSEDDARSLVVVAPLTSQIRGMRGEVFLRKPGWLPKISAVNVQGLASFDPGRLVRRMGTMNATQMEAVEKALRDLLGL